MLKNNKGVSLIIVIFAMMLFGVLGWTLAVMLTTDFDANVRSLDSERALYTAEAGVQWALGQLHTAFNCSAINATAFPHTFAYGQYACACSQPPGGGIEVVSTGYLPLQNNYRAMRQVKVTVLSLGLLNNVISGAQLFDWSNATSGQININGDMRALNFDRDKDVTYNELGVDVGNTPNLLPPGSGTRTYGQAFTLPAIDEADLLDYATNTKGRVFYTDQTFSGQLNNKGVYFVYGNAAIISGGNLNKTTIYATGNITITGSVSMKASNSRSANDTFPNLATKNGNIYTTDMPGSITRDFDGLIYSQNGYIDLSYIQGVAVMAPIVRLRGYISLTFNGKYVDGDAFIHGASSNSIVWQEQ